MKPMKHQVKASKKLLKVLNTHGVALLSGEPRSGKTLSFLLVAKKYKKILIITQKSALADIGIQATALGLQSPNVSITNFHQAKKLIGENFDLVVIDEAHRWVCGYPKFSTMWKDIKPLTAGADVIFSSGTLTPQSYSGLFPMLALSNNSPWKKYSRFTEWFNDGYGRPYSMRIGMHDIAQYDRTHERKVLRNVKKLTVKITRKEAGHIHEAIDKQVKIEMSAKQKKISRILEADRVVPKLDLLAETPAKLLQKLHQVSGGFVKNEEGEIYVFKKNPKIEWLLKNIIPGETIILSHYIAEQEALSKIFPHTGSVTKLAEGVDFSHFKTMVIYSMSFSASTYQQVRARQMNINRKEPITILYLTAGIDEYVYQAVQEKKNFTRSWYEREIRK